MINNLIFMYLNINVIRNHYYSINIEHLILFEIY